MISPSRENMKGFFYNQNEGIMKTIAEKIRKAVIDARKNLENISEENAGFKSVPDKWSIKEILGHLIDSAANNHQRFVRAAYDSAKDFPPYNQNLWVEVQRHNLQKWSHLIDLFTLYNFHLCHILDSLSESVLTNQCGIGKENTVTIKFVIEDYLRHLQHHLTKIFETTAVNQTKTK